MANETTTTTLTQTVYGSVIAEQILQELRPYNCMRPLVRTGPPGKSKAFDFTLLTKIAPTEIRSITEAADQSTNTPVASSKQTATAAQKGIIGFVTDLVQMVSVLDVLGQTAAIFARTAAEQWETDIVALTNFTTVTGGATPNTMARLLSAVSALEQRDITGSIVGVVHPKQWGDIRSDVVSSTSAFLASESDQNMNAALAPSLEARAGDPFGIPVWMTSVVPSGAGSFNGSLFRPQEAIGYYELWAFRTELQRNASQVGSEVVLTSAYGGVKISDTRGQGWLSTT